jgi:hypothetical protein
MADPQTVVIAITLEDVEEVDAVELVARSVRPALEMLHNAHVTMDVHWSFLGVLFADESEVTAFASRRIGGGK